MLAALIAAELCVYLVCGLCLSSALRWDYVWGFATMLGFALAARFGIVAASFALAQPFRERPDGTWTSWLDKLRVFCVEFSCFTLLFTLLQPLERWLIRRRTTVAIDTRSPPVVMIPGIYCNAGIWWWMRRRLAKFGLRTTAINLEPLLASIEDLAQQLAVHIESVCGDTGADRVILLGHSMGGLVARTYVRRFGAARVAKVITLATPHHGSELARFAIGVGGKQLRPGNPWLTSLNESESAAGGVPLVSLFTWRDNFVAPQDSPMLANATNIGLTGMGHLSLLFSAAVAQHVRDEILAVRNEIRA
jgi:triacylglycerol esterase/lipase EstA (alpha/beta hydrolase family)